MGFLSKTSKSSAGYANAPANVGGMPLQAKLRYGQPGDSYEREADRVADSVVSNSSKSTAAPSSALSAGISGSVQKSADEKNNSEINKQDPVQKKAAEKKDEKPVQKKALDRQDDQRQVQKKSVEDKKDKPVQKKDNKAEDKKPVQKKHNQTDEKQPVQKKAANNKEEKPVQKKGAAEEKDNGQSDNIKAEDPDIERELMATKNTGNPMEDDVRKEMENQFGQDFTNVVIHNDGIAHELNRKINAQAFTHGNHIYFGEGKYDPQTTDGKRLLAHELTHIVQQNGKVQKMVQKAGGKKTAETPPTVDSNSFDSKEKGTITKNTSSIVIPELRIPAFKKDPITPSTNLTIRKGRPEGEKRDTDQKTIWESNARKGLGLESALNAKLAKAASFGDASNPIKYTKIGKQTADKSNYVVGTATDIKNRLLRPYWKTSGAIQLYEVDHKLEYQLNGPDDIDNLWLLERTANGSSGRNIANEIESKVNALLNASSNTEIWGNNVAPAFDNVKRNYTITFQKVSPTLPVQSDSNPPDTYTLNQIKDGEQVKPVVPLSLKDVKDSGLQSDATHLVIFNNATGGKRYRLNISSIKNGSVPFTDKTFLPGFVPSEAILTPGEPVIANLMGVLWPKNPVVDGKGIDITIPILAMDGIPNTGRLNVTALRKNIEEGNLNIKPFSPIKINSFDVDGSGEMDIVGKVITNIPIIDGADINFAIRGNDIRVEKTFTAGDLKFPSPVKVPSSSITFAIGTESGLSAKGEAAIEIKDFAKGTISAFAQSGKGGNSDFGISGHLEFDKKLFKNKASVDVSYDKKNGLAIGGTLEVKPDPKYGIEKATLTVQYAKNVLEANGTATFKTKAIKEASLHIKFGEDVSEIDGDVKIAKVGNIINEGEGQFKIEKKGDDYDVEGSGDIKPNIPGVNTDLAFKFHNDMFMVNVTISDFHYGRITGSLNIGITNEELADGKPTGKASDDYKVFGESSLGLKVTDDIMATATLTFKEDGGMEIKGGITLPGKFQVVPPLLDIHEQPIVEIPEIHIPLFAIPLGVTDIGLEAVIAPRLTGDAHLGPGYLTNVGATIDFDPAQPEDLSIAGHAEFDFLAGASITAGCYFGVGVSAGIASISGGVDLSATAGIEAEQPVLSGDIKYSPKTGFELSGELKVIGKPYLDFAGSLEIKGSAGVWPLKVSHTWTWPIADKKIAIDAPLGFSFKFGYQNHEANYPTFDKWDWHYPKFDGSLMTKIKEQMIDPIKDEVF